jgi:hypothetical protein
MSPPQGLLQALGMWLDSWAGIGRIAVGMARQGYDLQLTRYDVHPEGEALQTGLFPFHAATRSQDE